MAKDKDHYIVKEALVKDGWTITHDPYYIETPGIPYEADLGAEKLIAASKGIEKILVEIKTFNNLSKVYDFHLAIGQFHNYKVNLVDQEPDRVVFIAMPDFAYEELFQFPAIEKSAKAIELKLAIYNRSNKEIVKWIKK